MLRTTMIGYLGRDAEVRDVNNQKVISFTIAHTEKYTNRQGEQVENTTWVSCSLWRQPDKTKIADYLKKGTQVYIEGFPSARAYTNKEGQNVAALELRVLNLELLGSRSGGSGNDNYANQGGGNQQRQTTQQNTNQNTGVDFGAEVDDLPF